MMKTSCWVVPILIACLAASAGFGSDLPEIRVVTEEYAPERIKNKKLWLD